MTRAGGPRLVRLEVADEPASWEAAGFAVAGTEVRVGDVTIGLTGRDGRGAGIHGWALSGLDLEGDRLDGLPTTAVADGGSEAGEPHLPHPNGALGLDHVVVTTPDLGRTIDALEAVGLRCRRVREANEHRPAVRQAFFRLGPVILEVVGGGASGGPSSTVPASEHPASWFGLALDVDDLGTTARLLGDHLGRVKDAIQPGRRIATLRHRPLDISVPIAFMDRLGPPAAGNGGPPADR
jgi:catechol 2,3-dioxygenase-like lactoylglutathione lyase family enzyme